MLRVGGPAASTAATRPAQAPRDNLGDLGKLARDQRWFLAIFAVKVALGLVAFAVKPWLGLLFFAAYGVYFWLEIRADGGFAYCQEPPPLPLPPPQPPTAP